MTPLLYVFLVWTFNKGFLLLFYHTSTIIFHELNKSGNNITFQIPVRKTPTPIHENYDMIQSVNNNNDIMERECISLEVQSFQELCPWFGLSYFATWFGTGLFILYRSTSFRVTSQSLGQLYDCPSGSEATLKNMGKYTIIIPPKPNHVPILWGMMCSLIWLK